MARAGQVALAGSQGLSIFSYIASEESPLHLTASAPASSTLAPIWSPCGSRVLTIAQRGVQIWSKAGELLQEMKTDAQEPVSAAAFYRDGVVVASGNASRVYSRAGKVTATLGGHPLGSTINALVVNTDHSLVACTAGSSLVLHDPSSQTQRTLHSKPKSAYSALAFSPTKPTLLAAGTSSGLLHLFETTRPSAPLRTLALSSAPHPPPVTNLAFAAVAPLLVATTSKGQLSLIDTEKRKVVLSLETGVEIRRGGMALGPDGRTVLLLGDGVVRILDIKARKGMKEIVLEGGGELGGIAFQPAPIKPTSYPAPNVSPIKPSSTILKDSINRMRAAQRSSSAQKEEQPYSLPAVKPRPTARPLDEIDEVFSPLRSEAPRVSNLDLAQQDLPSSKETFAESIAREARTSTLRSADVHRLDASAERRAHSSLASFPSPNLPSYSPGAAFSPIRRSGSSVSLRDQFEPRALTAASSARSSPSTRAPSPAMSTATSAHLNETIGALTRGLKLPELEHGSTSGRSKEQKQGRGSRPSRGEVIVLGDTSEGSQTPVPKVPKVKTVKKVATKVEKTKASKEGERPAVPLKKTVGKLVNTEGSTRLPSSVQEAQQVIVQPLIEGASSTEQMLRRVMEEYAVRTARDVQNLHLELIRQTFAQKNEVSSLKGLFGAEVQLLREENARLRRENEALRNHQV